MNNEQGITIDDETADILDRIAELPDDPEKIVASTNIEPEAFHLFLQETGLLDDSAGQSLLKAAKDLKRLQDKPNSDRVFWRLYKAKPECWVEYLEKAAISLSDDRRLSDLLVELRRSVGKSNFIDGFSDVWVALQKEGPVAEYFIRAVRRSCSKEKETEYVMNSIIKSLMQKGYDNWRLVDIRVGHGCGRFALFYGRSGSVATEDSVVFELLRTVYVQQPSFQDDEEKLKEIIEEASISVARARKGAHA